MFLQVCVILFTGGEYLTRYPPPDQVHPPPGTRYTPLGPGTPPGPGTHTPPTRYTPPDQVPPPGPGRYGLRADGTHPTGMHSCFSCVASMTECFKLLFVKLRSVHLQNISNWNQLSRTSLVKESRSSNGIHRKRWLVRNLL